MRLGFNVYALYMRGSRVNYRGGEGGGATLRYVNATD